MLLDMSFSLVAACKAVDEMGSHQSRRPPRRSAQDIVSHNQIDSANKPRLLKDQGYLFSSNATRSSDLARSETASSLIMECAGIGFHTRYSSCT